MNTKARFGMGMLLLTLSLFAIALFDGHPVHAQGIVQVPTVIDVTDPASGLITVEITYPAALLPDDYLYLSFHMLADHPDALKSLAALAGESAQELPVETRPGVTQRVRLTDHAGSLLVRYTLDPLYFPPQYSHDEPLNAAARLTAELGVLRTSDILPDGAFAVGPGEFVYQTIFRLPDGWQAITPWPAAPDGTVPIPASSIMQTEYLAVGPFVTEIATFDTTQVVVGTVNDAGLPAALVIEILTHMADLFESAPQAEHMAVSIVPEDFLYGGSAGTLTISSNADPHFVAHEMIHWWNTLDLTAGDATAWFREGFTEYYSLRMMRDLGIWNDEILGMAWDQYGQALAQLDEDPAPSLVEASERQQENENYVLLVYVKGALFARLLDTTLEDHDRSLDEAMRVILSGERRALSNADLHQIFHDVYDGLVDDLFERYVLDGAGLP
ncbi:MAG: hypothetical protein GXY36_09355 [Chloroflexi bacterium]|nr:hypothetical protein [Chloroflexota bacterium]